MVEPTEQAIQSNIQDELNLPLSYPATLNPATSSLKKAAWWNHAKGTLIGNCVGDAIGLSTEFMTGEEAKV